MPAPVAQGIERGFPKPCVAGSNPAGSTTISAGHGPVAGAGRWVPWAQLHPLPAPQARESPLVLTLTLLRSNTSTWANWTRDGLRSANLCGMSTSEQGPAPDCQAEGVTIPVRIAAAWAWRIIVIAAAGYLVVKALGLIPVVSIAFIVSLLFTAVLQPIERGLNKRVGAPKWAAVAISLLLGVAVVGVLVWFIYQQISLHYQDLLDQLAVSVKNFTQWLRDGPLHLRDDQITSLNKSAQDAFKSRQGELVGGAVATVSIVSHMAAGLFLAVLSTFFLLKEGDQIWAWVVGWFPRDVAPKIDRGGRGGWFALGGYMRGQTAIAVIHAVTMGAVLGILKVPLAIALSVVIFLGSYVPIVGITVSGVMCTAVAFIEHGVWTAAIVAGMILLLAQVEAHLAGPLIMAHQVKIHPLAVAISVLAGATLAGIAGALLAVPLVAFAHAAGKAMRHPGEPVADAVTDERSKLDQTGHSHKEEPDRHAPSPPKNRPAADAGDHPHRKGHDQEGEGT